MSEAAAPLRIRPVYGAVLVPVASDPAASVAWRIGGFDAEGAPIPELRIRRFQRLSSDPDPPLAEPARCVGEHVYAGVMFSHYGHFLLESLARLWALSSRPDMPLVWQLNGPRRPWQDEVLRMAGLDRRPCVFVRRPLRFDLLHVPEPGFVIGHSLHPAQAAAVALCDAAPAGRRIWLSRSALPHERLRIGGEEAVEALLAARGFEIVYPERHGVAEQAAMLGSASVVAGIEGSAFHTLLLVAGFAGRVLMVPRNARGPHVNGNHGLIFGARGVRLTLVPGLLRQAGEEGRRLVVADPAAAAEAILAA